MKQTITRSDGITYERNIKKMNYNKIISIKINEKIYEKLDKLAEKENIKISTLIREILEDYVGE